MSLSFTEQAVVTELATLLYEFLPASGNNATSFPLAAAQAGLAQGWPAQPGVSKRPGITHLVTWTLERRRDRFCALIEAIVGQSMQWRGRKPNPLSRAEIEHLNRLLERLHLKIPALWDNAFLQSLPAGGDVAPPSSTVKPTTATVVSDDRRSALQRALLELHALEPQPRGFAFEKFLVELFDAYGLAPRGSFRLQGEQIDGSVVLGHETYLFEAKWQNALTAIADLHAFAGKVRTRATWTRGLFISHAGFSPDALIAFGRSQPVICIEGLDLYETLQGGPGLEAVLAAKVRRAAETGQPFVRYRDLF